MRKALYLTIIIVGLLQTIGYLFSNKIIRGIGLASGSSPLPIVFTEVKGLETFASDFYIQFTDTLGRQQEIKITPVLYSKLQGPYNRRNVYGAAISYGPILSEELCGSVLNYGLCKKILIQEMELPSTSKNYSVRIVTKTKNRNAQWILKPNCTN
jgi:hypothetical protein